MTDYKKIQELAQLTHEELSDLFKEDKEPLVRSTKKIKRRVGKEI